MGMVRLVKESSIKFWRLQNKKLKASLVNEINSIDQ